MNLKNRKKDKKCMTEITDKCKEKSENICRKLQEIKGKKKECNWL